MTTFGETPIVEDDYNMIDHTEETMIGTEHINKIFEMTNLYGAFCFLCVRYYRSYKPNELEDVLKERVTDPADFPQVAAEILEIHGYHLDLNSVSSSNTGYKENSANAKVISDAARCVANTIIRNLEQFEIP